MENRITVFVPTYNRAKELPRLLQSLKEQDYSHFELLIVDDGSTDNTKELIDEWKELNLFTINYFKKENGGKHTAYNKGIEEVKTELFVEVDSDDYLKPYALSTIINVWDAIPNKEEFAGIQALCTYENGEIIGTKFPKTISNNYEIRTLDKVKGDKCIIYQSSKLKKHRFPEYDEVVVLMSILHNRVSVGLKTYCLNIPLKTVTYLEGGLTNTLRSKKRTRYQSFMTKFNEYNYYNPPFGRYLYNVGKYTKNALLAGYSFSEINKNAVKKRWYFPIGILYGYLIYGINQLKKK